MPTMVPSRALPEFCAAVVHRHASAWPPAEHQLAQEFLAHFGITRFGFYHQLVGWCGEVGVDVSTMAVPHDLRGSNFQHEHALLIVMPLNGGDVLSREHTLLHELREVLERMFADLGYPAANRLTIEAHAEQFAACVRVATSVDSSKALFAIARDVPDPFGRTCAYGLVAVVTALLILNCVNVRQLEAQIDAQQSQQPT